MGLLINLEKMGYKGQRKSLKRVAAPKMWYLGKLKGVYSTRPAPGPHKLRECIPLNVILQQRLKYALNRQDSLKICKDREGMIKVDGKVRREHRFPLGQMDVLTIDKTNEPIRIDAKEASFKLCKVVKKYIGKNKVPYVVTHDGRSIRFHIQRSKRMTLSRSTSQTVKSNLSSSPSTVPPFILPVETILVELVFSSPSRSIRVHTILVT